MPDPNLSPEEQQELFDAAKSRDHRLALIEQSLDIEAELRDSKTWRYFLHRNELAKIAICEDLAAMSADRAGLNHLQARAIACTQHENWLRELIGESRAAEQQIAAEDGRLQADE